MNLKSAVTLSLVAEAKGGPFVFWHDLAKGFETAARLGFDAVEMFPTAAEALDVPEVKRLSQKHGLKVAAIGSGAGWVKHKLRLTDARAEIRTRAREFVLAMVEQAAMLDAPVIIGSMQGRLEDNVSREQAIEWLSAALNDAGDHAEALGVPLLYEFLNRYETDLFNRVAESVQFLQSLRSRNVRLLCDLFHMNIEEADIAAALRMAGPLLGHIHFVDSNRRAVGMGHTDMKPVIAALREIGYVGYLSAEVLPLPDSESAAQQSLASFRRLASQA